MGKAVQGGPPPAAGPTATFTRDKKRAVAWEKKGCQRLHLGAKNSTVPTILKEEPSAACGSESRQAESDQAQHSSVYPRFTASLYGKENKHATTIGPLGDRLKGETSETGDGQQNPIKSQP